MPPTAVLIPAIGVRVIWCCAANEYETSLSGKTEMTLTPMALQMQNRGLSSISVLFPSYFPNDPFSYNQAL